MLLEIHPIVLLIFPILLTLVFSFFYIQKLVVSIIEEEHVVSVVEEYTINTTIMKHIEEDAINTIVIKSFNVSSILEQKITEMPILDFISELKQKDSETCQATDDRRQKEWKAEYDAYYEYYEISKEVKNKIFEIKTK
jgi:hypothetical protein